MGPEIVSPEVKFKPEPMPAPEVTVNMDTSPIAQALMMQGRHFASMIEFLNQTPDTNVTVNNPRIKRIKFKVTGRDRQGDLTSFEAIPEYENG